MVVAITSGPTVTSTTVGRTESTRLSSVVGSKASGELPDIPVIGVSKSVGITVTSGASLTPVGFTR